MSLEESSSSEEEWEEWEEEGVRVGRSSRDGGAASGGGEAGRDIVYRGVRCQTTSRWVARMTRDGVRVTIGDDFKTAEAAARAYDVEQRKAFGMHTLMCNFLLDGSLNLLRNDHFKMHVYGWAGLL